MKTLSRRETGILLAAIVVVPAIAFYRFRFEPYTKAATKLEKRAADAPADSGRLAMLERMSADREQSVRELSRRVAELAKRFAPKTNAVLQPLVADVSALASRSGVRIEESTFPVVATALSGNPADAPRFRRAGDEEQRPSFLRRYPKGERYERPLLRLRVASSFDELRAFFAGLGELRWRVTPIQFDVRRRSLAVGDGSGRVITRLETTLLLAL
jgi:uncharacterized coiled-coil protein SlyX